MNPRNATVAELHSVPVKAEIVAGQIVHFPPAGARDARAAGAIAASLYAHEEAGQAGYAVGGNAAFIVDLPNRQSFSPDAAWYTGSTSPQSMDFADGAPAFAAEVRGKEDYGPKAERAMADKIRDYFAAGTEVVWDVDLLREDVIRVHRSNSPGQPTVYRRGEMAEAVPAVPGWTFAVDRLFR